MRANKALAKIANGESPDEDEVDDGVNGVRATKAKKTRKAASPQVVKPRSRKKAESAEDGEEKTTTARKVTRRATSKEAAAKGKTKAATPAEGSEESENFNFDSADEALYSSDASAVPSQTASAPKAKRVPSRSKGKGKASAPSDEQTRMSEDPHDQEDEASFDLERQMAFDAAANGSLEMWLPGDASDSDLPDIAPATQKQKPGRAASSSSSSSVEVALQDVGTPSPAGKRRKKPPAPSSPGKKARNEAGEAGAEAPPSLEPVRRGRPPKTVPVVVEISD